MEYNYKAEERKVYFDYFRVWMILAAVAVIVFFTFWVVKSREPEVELPARNNNVAPAQRVYDYADVLTDDEEDYLENLIAECEKKCLSDIVLVTMNQEVGYSDSQWNDNMAAIADDIYDKCAFGYDQPHGDGALFLDNWYHAGQDDSQAGMWLSTSGKMIDIVTASVESSIFEAMDNGFETDTETGYAKAIKALAKYGKDERVHEPFQLPWLLVLIVPAVIALIYAASNMHQAPGVDTTTSTTYVPGGKPHINSTRDDFLRKTVTKVKIETESSRSGGGGGSYGRHTSSGGYSHGGGGHRR